MTTLGEFDVGEEAQDFIDKWWTGVDATELAALIALLMRANRKGREEGLIVASEVAGRLMFNEHGRQSVMAKILAHVARPCTRAHTTAERCPECGKYEIDYGFGGGRR